MPALLTSTSIDWKRDSAVSTILAAVAGSPMSPSTRATRSEAATSPDGVIFRELATTLKPRATNAFTTPAPMPCEAPVTMAVFRWLLMVAYLEPGSRGRSRGSEDRVRHDAVLGLARFPSRTLPGRGEWTTKLINCRSRLVLARPRQPLLEQPLDEGRQARAVVGVTHLLDGLRLRRVRMDRLRQRAGAELASHRERDFRDQVSRMSRHDGRAQDLALALRQVHLDEPRRLAVEDGPVHVGQVLPDRVDGDALLLGLLLVQADVGDLGIGVGTPRQDQRARLRPTE